MSLNLKIDLNILALISWTELLFPKRGETNQKDYMLDWQSSTFLQPMFFFDNVTYVIERKENI